MDIAVQRNTGLERAHAVEQCSCPRGYKVLNGATRSQDTGGSRRRARLPV